jgi:hypothetical protein
VIGVSIPYYFIYGFAATIVFASLAA